MNSTVILTSLVVLSALVLLRGELLATVRRPTPAGSVFLISVVYLIGAMLVTWRAGSAAASFVFGVYALHFGVYAVGYFALSAALKLRRHPIEVSRSIGEAQQGLVAKWGFFLLTFCLSVVAMYLIGADRLLASLFQFVLFGDMDESVLDLRLALASGAEGWMAPGYLKQLRDVLLPLATLLVLFTVRRTATGFVLLSLLLVPAVSVTIMSSGQRAPVLLFVLGAVYAAKQAVSWNLHRLRVTALPIIVMASVGTTAFLSLTSSFSSRYSEDDNVLIVLADRIVTRVPEENVLGAPVWRRGTPFPGAGWLSDLSSVLPGTQKNLSNLIHEYLGGRATGNSPLGTWIDVHYNFGWILGISVSVLLGMFIALFNHWTNVARGVSEAAEVCGLWISLCMLLVLSPFGFLLYGPFTASMLLLLVASWTKLFRPRPRLAPAGAHGH